MQGTMKDKEGTSVNGREGRRHLDGPKLKTKSRKSKVWDGLFSNLMGFL